MVDNGEETKIDRGSLTGLEFTSKLGGKSDYLAFEKYEGFSTGRRLLLTSEAPEAVADSWENGFTDPAKHDDGRFRYLVHGIQGQATDINQKLFLIKMQREGDAEDLGEVIDLLMQSHRIGDRKIISASVIDQDHRETFGNAGLVLRTPAKNVLDAFPEDAGTDFANPGREIARSNKHKCSVDELMLASSDESWNEVRLVGTTEDGKVQVAGFWVKVTEDGRIIDQETARQLQDVAMRKGLPLIKIIQKEKKYELEDHPPEVNVKIEFANVNGQTKVLHIPYMISVNRGGFRYNLEFGNNEFSVVNDRRKLRDMTPEEFAYAKKLVDEELDPVKKAELQDILRDLPNQYQVFHASRTTIDKTIEKKGDYDD